MLRINKLFRDSPKKDTVLTVTALADETHKRWKPLTLQRPFLLAVLLITLALLALVQVLVIQDKREEGLLSASKISELGAFDTFLHAYLPTILAVLYSLVWSWIDLDVKRIEPYRQLSKPGGASGQDSLLLHYPYDFLGFVPFAAFKRKHWPVFASSCALILVVWGITPLQGAIFATDTVIKASTQPMQVATNRLSIAEQAAQVTANYTYSASNIAWLGERMPAFMTRDAALTPFQLNARDEMHSSETWAASTESFSVNVQCEEPRINRTSKRFTTSQGCHVPISFGPDGTDVIGKISKTGGTYPSKDYSAFYAGSQNYDGLANYYLSPYCPKNVTNVFMVAFVRNRRTESDPLGTVAKLFCESTYVQQEVTASIRSSNGSVLNITDRGALSPLQPGIFNTSLFEWQINVATQQNLVRGPIPSTLWPDQDAQLSKLPITLTHESDKSSRIIGLALGADPRPLEEYLNPQNLAESFRRAHRLLFARAMTDVLSAGFDNAQIINGTRTYQIEAIRVVPGFAYAIESLLALSAILALFILAVNWNNSMKLQAEPESVTALMSLVGGQGPILDQFSKHDQSDSRSLENEIGQQYYSLDISLDTGASELKLDATIESMGSEHCTSHVSNETGYPAELSRISGALLALGLAFVLAALAYVFHIGQENGLPLPSPNLFVRQIVENYAPTLIATIIEPIWTLLNRILCTLQPFEGLRSGKALAQRTIDLNYTSLPPQLALFRASKARHLILVAVCVMTFLANVLAVAFSGMFNEQGTESTHPIFVKPKYEVLFQADKENITRSGPNAFYTAMANFTSSTPMPAWTDDDSFYVPMTIPPQVNSTDRLRVPTSSLDLDLDCLSPTQVEGYSWSLTVTRPSDTASSNAAISVVLPGKSPPVVCTTEHLYIGTSHDPMDCSRQRVALEIITVLKSGGAAVPDEKDECRQLIFGMWARKFSDEVCNDKTYTMEGDDATTMLCRPRLTRHVVNVTVTGEGTVDQVERSNSNVSAPHLDEDSIDGSEPIVREAIRSLTHWNISGYDQHYFYGGIWSNDSFPSSWDSYTMINMDPSSGILDPNVPAPSFDSATALFTRAYKKIFAVWISLNHEHLLAPTNVSSATIEGIVIQPEVRIMVSRSMVILSATILVLYIVVTLAVYTFQPAKFLPRMPTTIASDIALFAASHAVREKAGQIGRDSLGGENWKFGYGGFVGTDGEVHVGIERAPFVNSTCMSETTKPELQGGLAATGAASRDTRTIRVHRA